jgi:hypothetical protein
VKREEALLSAFCKSWQWQEISMITLVCNSRGLVAILELGHCCCFVSYISQRDFLVELGDAGSWRTCCCFFHFLSAELLVCWGGPLEASSYEVLVCKYIDNEECGGVSSSVVKS